MVKQVQKVAEGVVPVPDALDEQLGVMAGQHTTGPRQAEEGDDHLRRSGLVVAAWTGSDLSKLADGACGEAERGLHAEMYNLVTRVVVAHRSTLRAGLRRRTRLLTLPVLE